MFYFGMELYMFRTVPLSIIRSFPLYTQQWYMSYRFAVCTVENSWWRTEELSETCRVSLQNKKFEKLVHILGSFIRNLSHCTVIWTSKSNPHISTLLVTCHWLTICWILYVSNHKVHSTVSWRTLIWYK